MSSMRVACVRIVIVGLALGLWAGLAQATCEPSVGRFVSLTGSVEIQSTNANRWTAAALDTRLCQGDTIRVGERSRAAVALINDAVLRIDQNTAMRLVDIMPKEQERSLLDVFSGAIQSFSRRPKFLQVNTPYLNGSVEGTEFAVRVEGESTSITVFEGVVVAANPAGQVAVAAGESAQAAAGTAPQRRLVVRPRDQVNWSLYYPPVLSAAEVALASPELEKAANCAANGNTACAFAELDAIPDSRRGADHALLRASLLLSVGRVDEAAGAIGAALAKDSGSGGAHALESVIAVAQNDVPAALASGQKAVETAPGSPAARIALSYALQADLQLEAARDTLRVAVEGNPEAALAWARLAEMELALGDRRAANRAAETAARLQPGLGRTQNVLGFAALAEIRVRAARSAFEQAIALDSADPLPHLGLGLAKIRMGALDEGRADIEAAVALDSNNALLRAYLGKAYFEEKRGPLDAHQLEIAMQLDPQDPTAYLYDAIRLQTENRPVEALGQLEASIERNDNRAVYRSRLLLDKDRAARGTSLGRVFNDLGFRELGINSAVSSVTLDPANASAHRFLADVYRTMPRHETSRVSELQQAQMLQEVNINPLQPSLGETNLNITTQGGPAGAGFNEFTPLFERNRAQLNAAGFLGSNDTEGAEMVLSGVYDRFSLSAGSFFYDSLGFRPNNDLKHELHNLFGQVALSPSVNVQAEYQKRNSDFGDLDMNFDPQSFSASQRNSLDTESTRFGLTLKPTGQTTVLALYNRKTVDVSLSDATVLGALPPPLPPVQLLQDFAGDVESEQFEAALIFQADAYNLTVGAANTDVDRVDTINAVLSNPLLPPPGLIPFPPVVANQDSENRRVYAYGNLILPADLVVTLGASYEEFEKRAFELDEFNPKAGIVWSPTEALKVRAAYFKVVKPALASNRTLEPTQVAGFNQFFDDLDATRSERYGLGVDWQATAELALGAELTERALETPVDLGGSVVFEDRDEATHRAYAYWAPSDRWTVSLEAIYDKFENAENSALAAVTPAEVRTLSLPVKANYFHPNGLFGSVGVTYVDQEVSRTGSTLPAGEDSFSVVDFALGYRLPKRRGILSLTVHNLFDEEFKYQDDSYREFGDEPSVSPYTPERLIMGRIMLSF